MVMVFGEITTKAKVDYEAVVRKTCKEIGFVSEDVGLDADNCKVLVHIEEQSPDIGQGVHGMGTKTLEEVGAGDQGHMFGYATDETPEYMPLTHVLATKLGYRLTEVRKDGTCPWLRPDGKTQVTVEYTKEGGAVVPVRVHTILISTQHSPDVSNEQIHKELMEHVIKPVVPEKYLDDNTIFHLNPSGESGWCSCHLPVLISLRCSASKCTDYNNAVSWYPCRSWWDSTNMFADHVLSGVSTRMHREVCYCTAQLRHRDPSQLLMQLPGLLSCRSFCDWWPPW